MGYVIIKDGIKPSTDWTKWVKIFKKLSQRQSRFGLPQYLH